jgi:hypothetical protein
MVSELFLAQRWRVLTPEVFQFVLNNELKRALRSQNYLTLLVVEPVPLEGGERTALTREVAYLVHRQVRGTDLLSATPGGQLTVALLDADLSNGGRVVERLMAQFEHYAFSPPSTMTIGAACYPTHGSDAESLRREAEARRVRARRSPQGGGRPDDC